MGKDIDLIQAVRDEDLSMLQKLLDRNRSQRSSKLSAVNFSTGWGKKTSPPGFAACNFISFRSYLH